jgi:DNA-binding helix-turn-helix protein
MQETGVIKMPIDTAALKSRMSACGVTVSKLAKELGIDESTYYRRMANDGNTFTVRQAQQIATILNLSKRDAAAIFLP